VLKRKFIAISAYIKKQRPLKQTAYWYTLSFLKNMNKPNPNQQTERNNKNQDWDQWDQYQKSTQRINETTCWLFEKTNKIHKPLANMTKWKRENTKINKIRDDKGDITTNTNEI
jgi:hypothetical protein